MYSFSHDSLKIIGKLVLFIDGKLSALLLSMWFHNEKINAAMMEISKACFQDKSWKICDV